MRKVYYHYLDCDNNITTPILDSLIQAQLSKVFELAKHFNYNLGTKAERIIGNNMIDFADNQLMRESNTYNQLLKLEQEIREWTKGQYNAN